MLLRVGQKLKKLTFYTTASDWYVRDLTDPVSDVVPKLKVTGMFLEEDKSGLVKWLFENKEQFPWIYFVKEIDTAKNNNHIFYVIKYNASIIGYMKIGINCCYIHDFNEIIKFPRKFAFIYDTFILPEYRGKKLAQFCVNESIKYLNRNNYNTVLCHIENWNLPSIKVFMDAGFYKKDCIRYFKILFLRFFVKNNFFFFLGMEKYLKTLA